MKRYALLASILSATAYGHEVQPKSQFFKDEVAKNPMIQQVLVWCSLIGLDSEDLCREEMYGLEKELNPIRIDAAAKCVEKSGLQYKVAFDEFFKDSMKNPGLVSHDDSFYGYHLKPMKDPAEGPNAKEHYYYHTALDKQQAAFKMGDEFVARLKSEHEGNSSTITASGSGTAQVGVPLVLAVTTTGTLAGSTTKGPLTVEQIQAARAKGEEYGKTHPEAAGIKPGGYCEVGGNCGDTRHDFPESQLQAEVTKDVLPKPPVPPPPPPPPERELPPDPFAPFTSGTVTGGMPPGTEAPKSDTSTTPETPKDEKDKTTPIHSEAFVRNMNDCFSREEYKLIKEEGSKTKDQDAQTEEEKKAEAEAKLATGNCDKAYFGEKFCADFRNKQASHVAQGAEEEARAATEQAMENFQRYGLCDPMILGFQFCQEAKTSAAMHGDNPADDDQSEGSLWDPVTVPDSEPLPQGPAVDLDSVTPGTQGTSGTPGNPGNPND